MKSLLPGCGMIAVILAVFAANSVRADENIFEGCEQTFTNAGYGSASFRESCSGELSRRRAELAAWGIDARTMSKLDAWDRWAAESTVRAEARRDKEQRDRLESERLATERSKAQAEQEKVAAASARESERYVAAQMKSGEKMLQEQDRMLTGLGVDLRSSKDPGNCGDEYEADELRMYQVMLDNGVAPQCRNLSCGALVDCVDEVLDAEEE